MSIKKLVSSEIFNEFDKKLADVASAYAAIGKGFDKKLSEANDAIKSLGKAIADIPGLDGTASIEKDLIDTLTNGISLEKANDLLANDVVENEAAVKKTLSAAGVTKIPQNVFDGLISLQNELGDISYAYVGKEKIDLTGLYKNSEWDRAASFIAADERNRTRRIKEATIMVSNDYGTPVDESVLVQQGLTNTNGLILKGKLNQQTGEPATDQQVLAATTNYFSQTGKTLPKQSFAISSVAIKSATNNEITSELEKLVQQSAGPWPY